MARKTGVPAIKRLILSLLVVGAIACGAIYAIVTPPTPIIKPVASDTPSRTLAYQQQIAQPKPEAEQQAAVRAQTAAAKPAPAQAAPAKSAPAPKPEAAAPSPANRPQQAQPHDMAALPPDDEGEAYDPDALPWQQRSGNPYDPGMQAEDDYPGMPGEDGYAPGPTGAWPGGGGYPPQPGGYPPQPGGGYPPHAGGGYPSQPGGGYPPHAGGGYPSQPGAAWPGEDADPNAWPPQEAPQEFVQVLVSGAGMHGMASETAPMMFAFPSGRTLRVISRYGNWVEVTDPQSATTGWMKAQYLAPVAQPRPYQEAQPWYGEEEPRRRRRGGWFKRTFGGF
jgi:hypothetical protein